MKRLTLLFLFVSFLPFSILLARPISVNEARAAAVRWMLLHGGAEVSLYEVQGVFTMEEKGVVTCYIINLEPAGVVVISGDDVAVPVLMYTTQGRYDGSTLPDGLSLMLHEASKEIAYAIEEKLEAPAETVIKWSELLSEQKKGSSFFGGGAQTMAVNPLLTTTWNQNSPYNLHCPTTPTGGSGGRVYAGCVATSMAQVMRYHNAPAVGQGTYSYIHPVYGLQSADFGATTYQWTNMPASINGSSTASAKAAIAELIYHCAVSVDMDFSPTGSGSTAQHARFALVNYFRYSSGASYVSKYSYSASAWNSILTTELNNGRPMIYRGSASNGSNGHAWVLDGFSGSDYFHMNYGWGGYLDGYFYLNDITPGSNNFTYYQGAVIGIEPMSISSPTLISPANLATGVCVTPTLSWSAAAGATNYHLQVSASSTFTTTIVDDATITGTSQIVAPLSMGTAYYWRVRAIGAAGTSAWPASRSFTTRNVTIGTSGPLVFCTGGSVMLNTSSASGVSYTWSRDGLPIPGANQAALVVSTSGNYTVAVTQSGCVTTSAQALVTVVQPPFATILTGDSVVTCEGSAEVLSALTVPGATYQWKLNAVPIVGATTNMWAATDAGSYTVDVTLNGCSSTSTPTYLTVHPIDPSVLVWTGSIDRDWNTIGNWDNPCALPGRGDDVTIPGGTQPPTSIPNISLHDLTLNNAAGTTLSGVLHINGHLHLQAGTLNIGSHNLVLTGTATFTGGGAGSYVIASGIGSITQEDIGTAGRSGAVNFPVGTATGYSPLTLTNTTSSGDFSVRVTPRVLSGGITGSPLGGDVVDRTWHLSAGTGQVDVSLTLQWNQSDELAGFDRGVCSIARNEVAQAWDPLHIMGPAVGTGPFQRAASGVTNISQLGLPLAIGSGLGLYPVTLLSFTAAREPDHVVLIWRTADETNNHGFMIERSAAGSGRWSAIGFVPAHLSDESEHGYSWMDRDAPASALRYRLRQIDLDGSYTISEIIEVRSSDSRILSSMDLPSPHPVSISEHASIRISLEHAAACQLHIIDALGRVVRRSAPAEYPAGASVLSLDTRGLQPGMYLLVLDNAHWIMSRRIVLQK